MLAGHASAAALRAAQERVTHWTRSGRAMSEEAQVLLSGVNHVAILTSDTDRLVAFYREVFDAEVGGQLEELDGAVRLTFIRIGETAELNVFQVAGNTEADRQTPMFGRGR